ncbi:MAG TPA: IclR family transcriptional regulator [Streptosporangiaceae bacterium]
MNTLVHGPDGGNQAGDDAPGGAVGGSAVARGPSDGGLGDGGPGAGGSAAHGTVTGVGVLDRSVSLLGLLAAGPRMLRWLSEASGLPRPTAYRLLVALEGHRLVARDASGAFRLGPRLTELAIAAGPELDLAALAGPVLASLHQATGESAQLYVRSGTLRLCVAARDAGTGLRDSVPVGALLPLDAGSGGKVLLAWSADPAELDPELAAVRRRGWAASVAEREPGVASVSAPVLAAGQLLGALCVSGPASRIGQSPGKRLAPQVIAAATALATLTTPA